MGTVNSCCCCTLAQGTIGAGMYTVIESVVSLIKGGALLRKLRELQNDYNVNEYNVGIEKFDKNQAKSVYRAYGWGYVILGAIYLLLAVLIFVAVSTRRRNYLLPWLVCTAILFILEIIGLFFHLSSGMIVPIEFGRIIFELGIMAYLYIVVYSYYNSLLCPTVYPANANPTTQIPFSQPSYVNQPPPVATGYSSVPSNHFKNEPPTYPEAVSNSAYVVNNVPYAAENLSHFPPPPSYSEAVKVENK